MPEKLPLFLISRIRAYLWKITPFFAKVGTSVACVLIGSGGVGLNPLFYNVYVSIDGSEHQCSLTTVLSGIYVNIMLD